MSVESQAIIAVLVAALLHASWNTLVKTSKSGFHTIALQHAWMAILVLPLAPFLPFPAQESYVYLGFSVLVHILYNVLLAASYKEGDLSLIYPVARGTGPIVVAILSPFVAAEVLSVRGYLGVGAISLGLIILAFQRGLDFHKYRRSLLYALATGIQIGIYTLADGLGVRASGSTASYIVWLFLLEGLAFFLLAALKDPQELRVQARAAWRRSLFAALMSATAYAIVIWALTIGSMAYIAALRETSVLFAAIIGASFLREPFGARRMFGSAVIAIGIVLLNL